MTVRRTYRNVKAFYHEFRRAIFDADAKPVQAFYWGVYKQRTSRWIKGCNCSIGYMGNENGRVYGKTIPYLAKTCLQRTGLPELIHANMKTDPEKYLVVLKRMPNLEQLTKAGLFRLAVECTKDYYNIEFNFSDNTRAERSCTKTRPEPTGTCTTAEESGRACVPGMAAI